LETFHPPDPENAILKNNNSHFPLQEDIFVTPSVSEVLDTISMLGIMDLMLVITILDIDP
jgi:hypothetical protein